MPRKAYTKTAIDRAEYQKLIKALKDKSLTCSDIEALMGWQHTAQNVQKIYNMIRTIEGSYPIYEPFPGAYKILQMKDIDNYRLRRKHG